MKAFDESARKPFDAAGLILLFAEKLAPYEWGRDEHNQTDILTSGLTSLPPSRSVTSGLWEFVVRYSGATVPEFHGVPCRRAVILMDRRPSLSKNASLIRRMQRFAKQNFQKEPANFRR